MAISTGYYPAQARLILDPVDYDSGGTDLGKVLSIHTLSIEQEIEFITEHVTGGTPVDASINGVKAVYLVQMVDWTEALFGVLLNNTNATDSWQGFSGYELGALLGPAQTSKLLVRPVNDANDPDTGDLTKPMLFIPRAVQVAPFNGIWDPSAVVGAAFKLEIVALLDPTDGGPAFYGDANDFPALGGGD